VYRYNSASLEGRSPPRVKFRLARGPVAPSGEVPPRSGDGRPLERGPISIESQVPPRASFRLARGYHGPAASIPAPPAGAFNALTFAGVQVKGESVPLRAWESRPGNAPPTLLARPSPPCATICSMVSNYPVALYHPLAYGRRTAPSKKDDRSLEGKTHDCSTTAWDGTVTSGQRKQSSPSPSALCDRPRRRDAILEAALGCAQDTP
jgi:hypothetical protein